MADQNLQGEIALADVTARVAQARQADVYFFAGNIERHFAAHFNQLVLKTGQCANAALFLTTLGGSGDAAYQMARCLQDKYSGGEVSVLVTTFCKSAGTLLTIGAKGLGMADCAELGPLDIQIMKPDTLGERTSGLTPSQSLSTLRVEAFGCFEKFFLEILESSGYAITTKTAALIAARMTAGLFQPVYAQIDPMRLGEFQRAVQIAMEYGKRLDEWAANLKDKALVRLINGYPSHEFVIDRREAQTLFARVDQLTADEIQLADLLADEATRAALAAGGRNADIRYLGGATTGPENGSGVRGTTPEARGGTPRTQSSATRNGRRNRSRIERDTSPPMGNAQNATIQE